MTNKDEPCIWCGNDRFTLVPHSVLSLEGSTQTTAKVCYKCGSVMEIYEPNDEVFLSE